MALTDNLGKKVRLMVVKEVEFGVYLGNSQEKVLLPKKQVPRGIEIGDPVEVFLYKDSSDRLIATTSEPKITLGELTVLRVVDTGRIGAFLDWGLEKDLLLPFREQTAKIKKGDEVLVALAMLSKDDENCRRAIEQLPKLSGCQVHTTVMLSEVDKKIFKKLGVDVTSEPIRKKSKSL